MAFNSNGQISYLILDSLSEGSKYGLEIIEYISHTTDGNYIMKKPTLYSCLTRMEKKGLISSSYWGESELGGKRHYYSITESGKAELLELAESFSTTNYSQENNSKPKVDVKPEQITPEDKNDSPTYLQQSNLFDLVQPTQNKQEIFEDDEDEDSPLKNQINFFDLPTESSVETEQFSDDTNNTPTNSENNELNSNIVDSNNDIKTENINQEKIDYYQSILETTSQPQPEKDDAVFLDESERTIELTPAQEEQNKKIYDTSSELKKYRKRKSFSENQIEMSVVYENNDDEQIQKERIAELKRSLLNLKNEQQTEDNFVISTSQQEQFYNDENKYTTLQENSYHQTSTQTISQNEDNHEENKIEDDGVLITERMSEKEIPVQRKITPPNIDVYDNNLPAPKRNSELEPTYKDVMSRIFERKKEKEISHIEEIAPIQEVSQEQNFVDYNSLKKYYNNQGIEFKEYKKTTSSTKKTNINLLYFINSAILFALSGISSAILYWIISATDNLLNTTNFMFYTIPLLFLIYTIYSFVKYKTQIDGKATTVYTQIVNWIIFGLASIIILIINILCGMQAETFGQYATSIFLPTIAFLIAFPINYYLKRFIFERYQ